MRFATVTGMLLILAAGAAHAAPPRAVTTSPAVLETFDYRGVTLDGGRMKAQYDEVRRDYLRIRDDDFLKSFRRRAGRPAPGTDPGGWYTSGTFHMFGQAVSGLARFGASGRDPQARAKAAALVHGWAECIAPDGFFFNTPAAASPHYVVEKMVGALVDDYVYCGSEEARDALGRITDWAMKNLSRAHHGWCAEWYTLSENLYRAYLATGEEKYLEFARVWEYPEYWDLYANGTDIFTSYPEWLGTNPSYHAYSHVNTLSGAAMAYEVTGAKHYLDTLTGAYDSLMTSQTYATGGYGPFEMLMPRKNLIESLGNPFEYKHFETQCGSWAAFKLCKYLLRFTGEARYGDWVELLVLNGIGASISASPDGRVQYCSDYHLGGGWKQNVPDPWTCCAGTRPMAVADYADLVWLCDADNLFVNLFTPSTVRWNPRGTTVTVRQRTRFPEKPATELVVSVKETARFGIRLRAPGWLAAAPTATMNGKPAELRMLPTGWAAVDREWRDGDTLRVTLPMELRASCMDSQSTVPFAVMVGPVVLAVGSEGTNPGDKIDPADLSRSLLPVKDRPLHYRLAADRSLVARPFYEFGPSVRYFVYFDPAWAGRFTLHDMRFTGPWLWGFTKEVGASAEYPFRGTGIRLLGRSGPDGGMARVTIDGRAAGTIDQYALNANKPFTYEKKGLRPGRHTLRLKVLPETNAATTSHTLILTGVEPLQD